MLHHPRRTLGSYVWLAAMAAAAALVLSAATGAQPFEAGPVTLVAVQMQVSPADYLSAETFAQSIDRYMSMASEQFGHGPNLVAFPEDVGLGLVFVGHPDALAIPTSIWDAALYMAFTYYGAEIQQIMSAPPYPSFPRALLLVRGNDIRRIYHDTFSRAARKYNCTIVAGSAPIPGPDQSVYNTSYVFGPGGNLLGAQRKVHLDVLEQAAVLDLTAGEIDDLSTIRTPAGSIGVAICLDAFYEDVVSRLVGQGARILVQPSFNARVWDDWQAQDWLRGMWTAVRDHPSLVAGVNPMMVGGLWEIQVEGMSSIVGRSRRPRSYGYLATASDPTAEAVLSAVVPAPMCH